MGKENFYFAADWSVSVFACDVGNSKTRNGNYFHDKAPSNVCKSLSPLWGRQAGMQGHTTLLGLESLKSKKKKKK